MSKVVFVGLGAMGFHLARHISTAGADRDVAVVGVDRDTRMTSRAATELHLEVADDAGAVVQAGDLVCLSVPDGRVSKTIIDSVAASGNGAGVTVLDMSSMSPADARDLAESHSAHGVRYVDAPVTGGVIGAEGGTLTTIVGAAEADLVEHRWALDAFSSAVVFAGRPGHGALLKTINNMVCNVAGLVSMEAISIARKAGIADDTFLSVLNTGTGRTYFSQVRYPTYIATQKFNAGMRIGLVNKDLDIAIEAATELGFDAPMATLGREIWRRALADFGPDGDTTLSIDTVARESTGSTWAQLNGTEAIAAVPAARGHVEEH